MSRTAREDLWRTVSSPAPPTSVRSDGVGIEAPWPGTLWVHPATAAFAVEWLVVERGTKRPRGCLLVPADCRPVLGIADVAVPADQLGGPLSVRCHLGQWVPPSLLQQAQATGQVAAQTLELVRNRRRQAADGELGNTRLGRDGGPSPAYEDWVEELGLAWTALRGAGGPSSAGRSPGTWLAACAVFVIGLGAGWYGGVALPGSAVDPTGTSLHLDEADDASTPRNFAQMVLSTAVTRGPLRLGELYLPAAAEHVMLYILLDQDPPLDEYRLHLYDVENRFVIWRTDGLTAMDEGHAHSLSTLVDRNVFGRRSRFRVELEGRNGTGWVPVLERDVSVRSAPQPPID